MDIRQIETPPANKEEKVEPPKTVILSESDEQWLDDHLRRIRKLITDEAIRAAKDRDFQCTEPEVLDVADAAKRFAPGVRFPDEPSFIERIGASLSGITFVSALLAIVFGLIGLLQPAGSTTTTAACFDIVKLFAGAVVGSTGAGVALASRRR
jgi:hypothetical protein